jgi:hypothetical protein
MTSPGSEVEPRSRADVKDELSDGAPKPLGVDNIDDAVSATDGCSLLTLPGQSQRYTGVDGARIDPTEFCVDPA